MNLKSKGVRRTLAATCSTAVVLAGASLLAAAPASAAAPTLLPTSTEATIGNVDVSADDDLAAVAYQVGTTDSATAERFQLLSGPTGGVLRYAEYAAAKNVPDKDDFLSNSGTNGSTSTAHGTLAVSGLASGEVSFGMAAVNQVVALGATVPGDYVVRFYTDAVADGEYNSATDQASPSITLHVKDVTGATVTTDDDWAPHMTATASLVQGTSLINTLTLDNISTIDARGSSSGTGRLATALKTLLAVGNINPSGTYTAGDVEALSGTTLTSTKTTNGATATGTWSSKLLFDDDGNADFGPDGGGTDAASGYTLLKTTTSAVTDNLVSGLTADAPDVAGSVSESTGTVTVKTGTASVAYTGTVTVSSGSLSGKEVLFTLTPGTNTPTLSADGTLVSNTAGVMVYSALTNAEGVATLHVTSSLTSNTTDYTVAMKSKTSTGSLTVNYDDAAATTIDLTSPTASFYPTTGTSTVITGRLLDQFSAVFQPAISAEQQVRLRFDQNNNALSSADVTGYATLSSGAFSYTYTPATAQPAGQQDYLRVDYGAGIPKNTSVYWTSADAPGSVTITTPTSATSITQEKGTATVSAGTNVAGQILTSTGGGMAYKSVTLTGTSGVYFSTASTPSTGTADDLKTTLVVPANSVGAYSAYAYFAKAGAATITVTSGTASKTVDVTVTEADDPYQVIAIDAAVEPGGTSVVTGEVKNAWGFPVAGTIVDLSLGASKVATLGTNQVTTNSEGVWSTTLTGASGGEGTATLTATLCNAGSPCTLKAANPTALAAWLDDAGLTIAHGEFQDTASITVDPSINKTTVSAPATKAGAGSVKLTGKAKPGSTVEIYAKPAGSSIPFALVGVASADSDGDWSSTEWVSSSTTFFAKTSVSTSSTVTVTLTKPSTASVKISATALGKGRVRVSVNGSPNMKGVITVYVNGRKATSFNSNAWGDALTTVRTTKGVKTFKVVFAPSGYTAGSASVTVRVR